MSTEVQEGDLLTGGTPATDTAGNEGNPAPEGDGGSETTPADDGSERPGWMDQLSGDLKDNDSLRRFESVSDAAKSYVELEGKLGNAVTVSEEPTEEELSRVRGLLGVPDSEEGYDFSAVKLPEGITLADTTKERLAKFAKDNELTTKQAESVLTRDANREYEAVRAIRSVTKEKREKAELSLRQDLGGDYDKTVKAAKSLLDSYGTDALTSELKDTGFGNSPALARFLGNIGLAISEGSAPRGLPPRGEKTLTAADRFPAAAAMQKERNPNYVD